MPLSDAFPRGAGKQGRQDARRDTVRQAHRKGRSTRGRWGQVSDLPLHARALAPHPNTPHT